MTARGKTHLTRQSLKELHLKQIFLHAGKQCGGISRAELTKRMKLSFPSVSALVDELLSAGVLIETGERESNYHGRPRTLLRLSSEFLYFPVFELKRLGYRFVLYDVYGEIFREEFLPFTRPADQLQEIWHPDLEEICGPLTDCFGRLDKGMPLADIVLSLPGNISKEGRFSSSASKIVSPFGFLPYLEEKTGRRVLPINRSDCFAYGERADGAKPENYIYLYISEGIGAGIVRDGQIFSSGPWRAGEVGHMSVDFQGRPCPCGSRGCLERYLSTDAITADCAARLPEGKWDFSAICQAYAAEDPAVEDVLEEKAEILCAAINNMFALHPISHLIIGGEITALGDEFLSCLKRHLESRVSSMYRGKIAVTFSKYPGESSTRGAFLNYVDNILNLNAFYEKEG